MNRNSVFNAVKHSFIRNSWNRMVGGTIEFRVDS